MLRLGLIAAVLAVLGAPGLGAITPNDLDERDRVVVNGNVHPLLTQAEPLGRPDALAPMERMILTLRLAPEAGARLDTLLGRLQDPASPLYHQWLTPEAFGEQFGPSTGDLETIVGWLRANEFTIDEVLPSHLGIVFSGKVNQVENAFRTLILTYRLDGQTFQANASEPSLPRALADLVHGVVSLHNLPRKALSHPVPLYNASGGTHYLAPADFATIYNVKPLYAAGLTGAGVTVAVVGRTHIPMADLTTFRSTFALPVNPPSIIVNGADPGDLGGSEDAEADLDVEWAGAVAKNATIDFVASKSTSATDGIDLSAQYVVNTNLASVMTVSFGQCEAQMGTSENNFYNNLWAQAASQGISVFVAAGDSGASGCSSASAASGSGQGVSGMASTPYDVCVGGTRFNEGSGTYWATTAVDGATALGDIPETAWNESASVPGGTGLWATGGGTSMLYKKPSWQVAPGVPADGRRDVPDVALTAASHDGYLIQSQGGLMAAAGTSCAAPAFAGIMALVVQSTGQRQGNPNPALYALGNAQYHGTGPTVFHDTLTGNNLVPGATGFTCGTGYDQVTGLGSVDAHALVTSWASKAANTISASMASPSADETVASGTSVAFAATAKDSSASATLSGAWQFGDGGTATGTSASHVFTNTGTASTSCLVTFTATDTTGAFGTATRTITVNPAPHNTLTTAITTPSASITVASGASVAFTSTAKDSSTSATLTSTWTFGDSATATATGASASHVFTNTTAAATALTVTLTTKDSTGVTATATRTVTVNPAPRNTLTATITTPSASSSPVASGASVAFAGTAKDSSTSAALAYTWTFGDGTTATGATASHVFTNTSTAPTPLTVTLTVKDSTGVTATATRTLTITPAPVAPLTVSIKALASTTVASGTPVSLTGLVSDPNPNPSLSLSWAASVAAPTSQKTQPLVNATTLSSVYTLTVTNTSGKAVAITVTFTATDNKGAKATASSTFTVTSSR